MTVEAEIAERIEWLQSDDPMKIGAALEAIQKRPFGHPGTAVAIVPLLESTQFYRITPPHIFCAMRLLAGAALAAEQAVLDVDTPVIVRQAPLKIWGYPKNKELWIKTTTLGIPHTGDANEDFKAEILGGLQMLYERGELGLELFDFEMKAAGNMWEAAVKVS